MFEYNIMKINIWCDGGCNPPKVPPVLSNQCNSNQYTLNSGKKRDDDRIKELIKLLNFLTK